jgi:nucleoside-diphosphate-sugar epimerase
MRVFVTGATGFIGSALVPELIGAGHEVVGLARSADAADALTAAGANAHRGALDDLDSLRDGATAADGVIHLAFNNDFSDYAGASAEDLRAVEALGAALEGSGKALVITSGTLALSFTPGLGTEDDASDPGLPRVAAEHAAIALGARGVRSSVVRLAPCVHDEDRAGLATRLIAIAREKGVSAYVGDGDNRWPGVHRLDAAHLYRLALEGAAASTRLHAVADEGVPVRDLAEVIGRRLDVPVVSISAEEAGEHFGFFAMMISLDNPTSSALTEQRLGWRPEHAGLLDDLEAGRHFTS